MQAEVITIGSEILSGYTRDTNFQWIAVRLAQEGIPVARHTVVPDEREALGEVLARALDRGPLVVTTGGLGVTPDDVTRRVMASVLGCKLIFRENVLEEIRERHRLSGWPMSPGAEAMALVPAGAQALPNPVGVAPGLLLRTPRSLLFALPGVPEEMRQMMEGQVIPLLRREGLVGSMIVETLRVVGIPEARLAEGVRPLLGARVQASYLPAAGRVDLRLLAAGGEEGRRELTAAIARLTERLGGLLYARGLATLEEVVVSLLRRARRTVTVAESLTGGRVGAALTGVPGSSETFMGGVAAYSDAAKRRFLGVSSGTLERYGAVSAQVAQEMAAGARHSLGAHVGISTTGIAGPGGGSREKPVGLVFFGLCDGHAPRSFRYRMGGNRSMVQEQSVTVALNLLRLYLIGRLDSLSPASGEGTDSA
jgi:nicotinamide-nucleotide amidase